MLGFFKSCRQKVQVNQLLIERSQSTYWWSNLWTKVLSAACIIHRRCMNSALQTPSSNLCRRPTRNITNKLKPSGDNHSENAFWMKILGSQLMIHITFCTDCCWDERLGLQQDFHVFCVNGIVLVVDDISRNTNLPSPVFVIHLN